MADDDLARCDALIGQAAGLRLSGGRAEAMDILSRAEDMAEQAGHKTGLAQIQYYRGSLLFVDGDREGCLSAHQKALDLATEADTPHWQAHALSGLGDAYYAHGQIATAHNFFNRSMELCHGLGLGARLGLGWIATKMVDYDAAKRQLQSGIDIARAVRIKRFEAVGLMNLARCLIFQGESPQAAELAREAADICRDTGMGFCGPGVLGAPPCAP